MDDPRVVPDYYQMGHRYAKVCSAGGALVDESKAAQEYHTAFHRRVANESQVREAAER